MFSCGERGMEGEEEGGSECVDGGFFEGEREKEEEEDVEEEEEEEEEESATLMVGVLEGECMLRVTGCVGEGRGVVCGGEKRGDDN